METIIGDSLHHGDEAATYAAAMDALLAQAWTGDQARQLILATIDALVHAT